MKKNNGFTLVELLAVIVVLALIMVLAIPSVLNAVENARKQSFYIYSNKLYDAALDKYLADYNKSTSSELACSTYKIPDDFNLADSGDYVGWIKVERVAKSSGNVELYKTLSDSRGLYNVRYCTKYNSDCNPNNLDSDATYTSAYWNVLDDANGDTGKSTTIRLTSKPGYHLCVSYEYINNNIMTKSAVDCNYQSNTVYSDAFDYKITLSMKDTNNAVENFVFLQKEDNDKTNRDRLYTAIDNYKRNHRNNPTEMRINELVCGNNPGGYIANDPNATSTTIVTTEDPDNPDRTVTVTNDTTHTQQYTQSPTQQPSTKVNSILLKNIDIYGYDINFNPGHITYDILVPYATDALSISWVKANEDVEVEMNGADNIQVGTNNIIIHAYNLKTNEEIFYYIKVVRMPDPSRPTTTQPRVTVTAKPQQGLPDAGLPSSNSKLSNIIISGYELSDIFSPEVFAYDVEIDEFVTELVVTPILQEPSATYTLKGDKDIRDGAVIEINVMSQNKYYSNTYTVTVHTRSKTNTGTVVLRAVAVVLGVVLVILLVTIRKQKAAQKALAVATGIEKGGYVDPTKIDK